MHPSLATGLVASDLEKGVHGLQRGASDSEWGASDL